MAEGSLSRLRAFLKHPVFPCLVGFGVACIHLVVTTRLQAVRYSDRASLLPILEAPGDLIVFLLLLILQYFLPAAARALEYSGPYDILGLLGIAFSGLAYGTMAGFLVSGRLRLVLLGSILIISSILFGCVLIYMGALLSN